MRIIECDAPGSSRWITGPAAILGLVLVFGADAPALARGVESGLQSTARGRTHAASHVTDPGPRGVRDSTPVRESLLAYMEEKKSSILHAMRTMPEARYDEKFVSGQRTFGQQARHVAEMNFAVCSALADETPPTPSTGHDSPGERLVELMRRSFEYCRGMIVDHGDSVLSGAFRTPEGRSLRKAKMLFFLVGNWADHYGHFATYLRMSGVEPRDTWAFPADILRATTRR